MTKSRKAAGFSSRHTGECDEDPIRSPGRCLGGPLMRFARIAILCALAWATAAPARAQTVTEDYDRISGARTIAYTADGSMDASMPVVTFEASFVGEAGSAALTLAFVSGNGGASGARFAACHEIDWRVDGRSLAIGRPTYRGRVVDGEMIELIVQEVDAAWASAIANAGDARYRVCRDEYAFTSRDIEAFGRIAAKLKSATGTTSSALSSAPAGEAASSSAPEVEYKGMNWRPKHQGSLFPSKK
ncbi:MAG: hypothetical protein ABWY31_08210 [Pseudoxanthomonas sp.]